MRQFSTFVVCCCLIVAAPPLWSQGIVGGFVENRGQWDSNALYRLQGAQTTTWITPNGWLTDLQVASGTESPVSTSLPIRRQGAVIRTTFLGANTRPTIITSGQKSARSNFFRGSVPNRWRSNVPAWGEVYVDELYPGIDVRYYLQSGALRYDLVIASGANPQQIRFAVSGATGIQITPQGALLIATPVGIIEQKELLAYQGEGERRTEVECTFIQTDAGTIAFDVGSYDPEQPLVIDPLVFSTLVGGAQDDLMLTVCRDSSGNIFTGGYSLSTDFPTNDGAYDITYQAGRDVVICKYSSDASRMLFATYLGGEGDDMPQGLASDATGSLLITGWTRSRQFPTTDGAFRRTIDSANTASFLTRLSPTGDVLIFSTFVTASYGDFAFSLATDPQGYAYLTGRTLNQDFPTTAGAFDSVLRANYDTYILKMNPSGDSIVAATLIGGDNVDEANSIALDRGGNVYITGATRSSDFPVTPNAYTNARGGNSEVFISKFNPALSQLLYSTVFGGDGDDYANAIAVTADGAAIVAGRTLSANFPTTPSALLAAPPALENGWITRLSADGSALEFSSFVGGAGVDRITGMGLDDRGNPYVVGQTSSADFPTTPDADFRTISGGDDAFVAKIHSTGTRLLYSSFFGSDLRDEAIAVAVDQPGNAYVAGYTSAPNFPTTAGAENRTHAGNRDGFLLKLPLVNPSLNVDNNPATAGLLVSEPVVAPLAHQVTFTVQLPFRSAISAQLFGIGGNSVGEPLPETEYSSGIHRLSMPLHQLPSGSYLLRVRSLGSGRPAQESIRQVVVVR
ncbi:MAG: SBBP repeat-containing protein [Armatimonadetes bacterium]|nr:SBBP repeat-containing protein [Armatimonadota bacterium]